MSRDSRNNRGTRELSVQFVLSSNRPRIREVSRLVPTNEDDRHQRNVASNWKRTYSSIDRRRERKAVAGLQEINPDYTRLDRISTVFCRVRRRPSTASDTCIFLYPRFPSLPLEPTTETWMRSFRLTNSVGRSKASRNCTKLPKSRGFWSNRSVIPEQPLLSGLKVFVFGRFRDVDDCARRVRR